MGGVSERALSLPTAPSGSAAGPPAAHPTPSAGRTILVSRAGVAGPPVSSIRLRPRAMPDVRFRSASPEISSQWEARRGSLERSLTLFPESRSSWLWHLELRICTFLVRRYGILPDARNDAPSQADQSTTRLSDPFPPLARSDSIRWVIPAMEMRRRIHIRTRQHPTLARLADVGHDTRERTLIIVKREEAKQARYEATWDRIAHFTRGLLIAFGAAVIIMILAGIALAFAIPVGVISRVLVASSVLTLMVIAVSQARSPGRSDRRDPHV